MEFNFSNRTVLITGGTRGIGKKIAEDLLSLGANLILSGTNPVEIEKLNSTAKKDGLPITYFAVDLMKTDQVNEFIKKAMNSLEFSTERRAGGQLIPPQLFSLYQKIKIPQTDPNALKHEVNQ